MKLSIRLSNTGLAALAGIAMLLMLFGIVLSRPVMVQTTNSDRVEAREFILRDSAGRERVRIAVDDNDSPGITLLDKSGTRRALLRLNGEDVPSLRMYDAAGKVDSVLGTCLNNNEPGLFLFDSMGTGRLASRSSGSFLSDVPVRDEDLYPNWRSELPQQAMDTEEWRIQRDEAYREYRGADSLHTESNSITLRFESPTP